MKQDVPTWISGSPAYPCQVATLAPDKYLQLIKAWSKLSKPVFAQN